jgi:hypothetical protein
VAGGDGGPPGGADWVAGGDGGLLGGGWLLLVVAQPLSDRIRTPASVVEI